MSTVFLTLAMLGQVATDPRFVLHSTGDRPIPGLVEKLESSGAVTMAGHPVVAGAEVVALRRLDMPTPPWPRGPHLLMTNGDRIAGLPTEISGSFLMFRAAGSRADSERLRFPLTSCAILWLRSADAVEGDSLQTLLNSERSVDQMVLRNGDVLGGVLTGIDPSKDELAFEANGMRRTAPISKVALVAFSTRLARVRKPIGSYWHLVLTNGTRLTLISAIIEKGELRGQTMYKDPVQYVLSDVAALDVYQGKAVYLSDIKPTRYEYRSYQGERHKWSADRSFEGGELQLQSPLGVATYDKGLAVHGECSLVYSLEGKHQRFECNVGIDPHRGKRGSAIVRVLIDGIEMEVNNGKPVMLSTGTIPVRVDVSKGKELKLKVDWGNGGHVGDRVNWGDARLIP